MSSNPGAFGIVGIGASAGGLVAFSELLAHLPSDSGLGFVLVQHLDPQHQSALAQLLGRVTAMPVREVTDHQRVAPNHVYVIPPNTDLTVGGGVLTLQPRPDSRAPHRSIDFFFETLARDQGARAVGVVLSGASTDGTLGLEAIKAEGGITFAQDGSAKYASMPRSAVAAGCVDFELSPAGIARELARLAAYPAAEAPTNASLLAGRPLRHAGADVTPDSVAPILRLLRAHAGVDFSLYKASTVQRRIIRRMIVTTQHAPEDYADFLRGNGPELDALFQDILISVTSFFRNAEAFDVLRRTVFPALLQRRAGEPIRAWVLGCSTGQEAYSVAMAFVEASDAAPRPRALQVFATDVNDVLLDTARRGHYPRSIAHDLSPERLRRFFVAEGDGYRVTKALRDMVVFARHNVISDPPFSRLDLVSCRNVLIYFEAALQQQVLPLFHYALRAGGFLYLGASESVGGFSELFEPVDKKQRIYVKKAVPTPSLLRLGRRVPAPRGEETANEVAVPPDPTRGTAPEGAVPARAVSRPAVRATPPRLAVPGGHASAAPPGAPARRGPGAAARRIAELERELTEAREYLQAVQAQHDAANDELQGASEEVQSANEELQSINEELETSKEELESANEELTTVNDELAHRNIELGRLNSDLVNVQGAVHMAIVLLGRDLTVRRFSAQAEKRFNLLAADVGRPMSQIRHDVVIPQFEALVTGVIETVRPRECEVQDTQGRWFSLRVRPYVTIDDVVDGAVLVLVDIDDLKRSAQRLIAGRDYVTNIIETVRDPLVVLDGALRVERVNQAFREMFQVGDVETDGKFIYDLGGRQWDIPELRALLSRILSEHTTIENFLVEREFVALGFRSMLLNARRMRNAEGATERIILAVEDITGRRQVEEAVRLQTSRFETLLNAVPLGVYLVDHDLRIRHVNPSTMHIFGNIPDLIGRDFNAVMHQLWPPEYAHEIVGRFRQTLATGEPYVTPERAERRLGREVTEYYEWQIHRMPLPEGGFGVVCYFRDVSAEVKTRTALAESDRNKDEFLAMLAHELRNPLAPILVSIDVIRQAKANNPALVDQALDLIRRQVGQMVRLVDDLLDVGRISRGKIDLRRERVDLQLAVQQVVDGTRALFERREQTLEVHLPAESMFLSVDPVRLAQIVGNLLNNANKFTPRGGHVWLSVEAGPQAVIRVRDAGIGISAEHLTSVFDLFSQVDTSLERASTGLGIGLTLVKTLTEMHGGSVSASSEGLGKGSEFVVRLPMEQSRQLAVVSPAAVEVAIAPLRILVVDDNHDAADSLAMLLTMNGHETHTVHDGAAAVEAAVSFRPDVILMDIGLPGLNGYEAARRIRAQSAGPNRPVLVAVTGWGQTEDRQRSKEAGFDVHVVKPMDDVTLSRMLAEYGGGRGTA